MDLQIEGVIDVDELQSGPSSTIFRAHHLDLERHIVIKVFRSMDQEFLSRFETDIKDLVSLSADRRIATVYGSGLTGAGQAFLLMELCDSSLSDVLADEGPMAALRACDVLVDVARAVATAHGENVVHGNLRPEKVLVDANQELNVADFGLWYGSLSIGANSNDPYAAPEVSPSGTIAPSADIYSFGAILGRAIDGTSAVPSEDDGADDVPELVLADVPDSIRDIIDACLETDPAERPSADELVARIESAVDSERLYDGEAVFDLNWLDSAPAGEVAGAAGLAVAADAIDPAEPEPEQSDAVEPEAVDAESAEPDVAETEPEATETLAPPEMPEANSGDRGDRDEATDEDAAQIDDQAEIETGDPAEDDIEVEEAADAPEEIEDAVEADVDAAAEAEDDVDGDVPADDATEQPATDDEPSDSESTDAESTDAESSGDDPSEDDSPLEPRLGAEDEDEDPFFGPAPSTSEDEATAGDDVAVAAEVPLTELNPQPELEPLEQLQPIDFFAPTEAAPAAEAEPLIETKAETAAEPQPETDVSPETEQPHEAVAQQAPPADAPSGGVFEVPATPMALDVVEEAPAAKTNGNHVNGSRHAQATPWSNGNGVSQQVPAQQTGAAQPPSGADDANLFGDRSELRTVGAPVPTASSPDFWDGSSTRRIILVVLAIFALVMLFVAILALGNRNTTEEGVVQLSAEGPPEPAAGVAGSDTQVEVPLLLGKSESDAVSALAIDGFKVEITYRDAPGQPAGRVMRQEPAAGSTATFGTEVSLTLSRNMQANGFSADAEPGTSTGEDAIVPLTAPPDPPPRRAPTPAPQPETPSQPQAPAEPETPPAETPAPTPPPGDEPVETVLPPTDDPPTEEPPAEQPPAEDPTTEPVTEVTPDG